MSGGSEPLSAEFWLLEAPDSLSKQSRRNPDGTGLGTFSAEGQPVVQKAPISAYSDTAFAREARSERSPTFLAHVRFATTGARTLANTHPFEQDARLFAHNGMLAGLARLDDELGESLDLVHGETDSERLFALITRETASRDGDVRGGLLAAVSWVAEHLPVYSLNLILTTESELFALRYPETHNLFVLDRSPGGQSGREPLQHRSSLGTHVRSAEASGRPVVVVASEPMDDDPGWRALRPGELVHVSAELELSSTVVLPDSPTYPLHPGNEEATSQRTRPGTGHAKSQPGTAADPPATTEGRGSDD
jgi:predicted glutamine amidotransferase